MMARLFDVQAIRIDNGNVRLIAEKETEEEAEAIMHMAICRRGVDVEFFKVVPTDHD